MAIISHNIVKMNRGLGSWPIYPRQPLFQTLFRQHPIKFITVQCFGICLLMSTFRVKYYKEYKDADGVNSFTHSFTIGDFKKTDTSATSPVDPASDDSQESYTPAQLFADPTIGGDK